MSLSKRKKRKYIQNTVLFSQNTAESEKGDVMKIVMDRR